MPSPDGILFCVPRLGCEKSGGCAMGRPYLTYELQEQV
jgi:hypothetical protein